MLQNKMRAVCVHRLRLANRRMIIRPICVIWCDAIEITLYRLSGPRRSVCFPRVYDNVSKLWRAKLLCNAAFEKNASVMLVAVQQALLSSAAVSVSQAASVAGVMRFFVWIDVDLQETLGVPQGG